MIIYFVFKSLPIFIDVVFGLFFRNTTLIIFIILTIAVDFWFTKNVAGRLMVGLKWDIVWSEEG